MKRRFKRPKRGWYRAKKDARRIWKKNKKYVYRYAKKRFKKWWRSR